MDNSECQERIAVIRKRLLDAGPNLRRVATDDDDTEHLSPSTELLSPSVATLIENAPADLRYLLDRVDALEAVLREGWKQWTETWGAEIWFCIACEGETFVEEIEIIHNPDCIVLTLPTAGSDA